ncbi:hypothetical protein BC834DRAFT_585822 [Gloeopeniophorella convolvens]|nr:hypothetical protein BC834DRAFT_585822 [Gloeopeniophorella convolvens]
MLVDPELSADPAATPRDLINATRKTVIFSDDLDVIQGGPGALYAMYPSWLRESLRELGFIQFYDAIMSDRYHEHVFKSFCAPDSTCKFLFAGSGFATGLSGASDIEVVIQYGMCQWVEDLLHRFGRGVQQEHLHGLSLLMYDPAALDLSKPLPKELVVSDTMKDYARSAVCRREFIARHLDDHSREGGHTSTHGMRLAITDVIS